MSKFTRILSIDGGGIRGIIPGQVLANLERLLEARLGSGTRIADVFDLIAGTSTGGILTCAYLCPDSKDRGRPRFSAEQAVQLYLERGNDIFSRSLVHIMRTVGGITDEKYKAEGLDKALDDYFGDVLLSDLLKPCLITSYNIQAREAHFFTQHDAGTAYGRNFYVRDVARATSAAPTFFEAANIRSTTEVSYPLVDGGVFANNPALCAYAEARSKLPGRPTAKDMMIVSLGTGASLQPYPYNRAKNYGLLEWARPVLDIMMSGVSETVDYQLRQIFDAAMVPHQYVRLNADLGNEARPVNDMDNATIANMSRLREIGQKLAEDQHALLERVVDLLLEDT